MQSVHIYTSIILLTILWFIGCRKVIIEHPDHAQLGNIIVEGILPTLSEITLSDNDTEILVKNALYNLGNPGAVIKPVYFTQNGSGDRSGSGWSNTLAASALWAKLNGITDASINQVYVFLLGAGTYKTGRATSGVDRGLSFTLKSHVAVIGGFDHNDGDGNWERSTSSVSILDGNINAPATETDNSYVVVSGTDINGNASLTGLTIQNGYNNSSYNLLIKGAGIFIDGSVRLALLNIKNNEAEYGAGINIVNEKRRFPVDRQTRITRVEVRNNKAINSGGGLYFLNVDKGAEDYILDRVNVLGNSTTNNKTQGGGAGECAGGGMSVWNSGTTVIYNSSFIGNQTPTSITGDLSIAGGGGGLCVAQNHGLQVYNSTFSGNMAAAGGGIILGARSTNKVRIINSTIANNTAADGAGIYISDNAPGFPTITNTDVEIVNSIFWGNAATGRGDSLYVSNNLANTSERVTIAHSIVQNYSSSVVSVSKAGLTTPTIISYKNDLSDPLLQAIFVSVANISVLPITTGSSAVNKGVYVRQNGFSVYYSEDQTDWGNSFGTSGITNIANLTGMQINPIFYDATVYTRNEKPDAGAYEAR